MNINRLMEKRTHWYPKDMINTIHELAINKGVSDSDIVRMAIKEYAKKERRKE
jgi:hypothetical protein